MFVLPHYNLTMKMTNKTLLSLFLITVISVSSCAQNESNTDSGSNKIERVSASNFKKNLSELSDYQLIDVRTSGECENGVIEGAINIDYQASDFEEKIAALDKTKPTLVYCAGGVRSAKAAEKMSKMGFVQIIDLKGGYGSWDD